MPDQGKKLLGEVLKNDAKRVDFDLDNWITDFEDGFLKFEKINPRWKDGYWGQGFKHRPRIKEVNEQANAQTVEGYRIIEFFPDRENKNESFLMFGTPLELMTQITLLMNIRFLLDGQNIGAWLGYPVDEYLRAHPRTEISVQIILTTNKEPPFWKTGTKWFSQRQVTIPRADKTKLTFSALREACGGSGGQDWGEWSARAYLSVDADDKQGLHQMVCGGSTKEKAGQNLEKFLVFTKCKVRKISYHQVDYTKGDIASDPNKASYNHFKVYPAWISVLNSKLVKLDDARKDGKKTLSGKMLSKKNKMFIHMEKEPSWWADQLKDIINDQIVAGTKK